jgi:hypothetical protein
MFALVVVAPLAIAVGVLVWRGHRAGPALAFGPAVYALYIFAEEILAPDYLGQPGNSERFFPWFVAVFILAGAVAIGAWGAVDRDRVPPRSRRANRLIGGGLLAFAAFMVVGRYVPAFLDVMSAHPTSTEYLVAPTLFWTIALEDLGIVLPAAVAVGLGLLRGARWAGMAAYPVAGWLALVPAAVAAMMISMLVNDDPAGSVAAAVLLSVVALACLTLATAVYQPLFTPIGHRERQILRQVRDELVGSPARRADRGRPLRQT